MRLPPEGAGTVRAFSRIGYDLPAALADLIDNSIDAGASRVEITFFRDDHDINAVTIADDGRGMDADELRVGMQFAGKTTHRQSDLGTYGMGLKSASFSQCSTLTVVSRRNQSTIASRWSAEEIDVDWRCAVLDPTGAKAVFDDLCMKGHQPACGTLVIWERLDRLGVSADPDALNEFLSTALPRLNAHLGLVFHRYLQQGALAISVAVRHSQRSLALPRNVRPINPFGYQTSGAADYPKTLVCALPNVGTIELQAHIWPENVLTESFNLGGKRGAECQGFYFYRNNRLIQAGGWNGVFKNEHDAELCLARIAVDLPPGGIDVNVQKSALQVTAAQAQAFIRASDGGMDLPRYAEQAKEVYRAARRRVSDAADPVLVPSLGLPYGVRNAAERRLSKGGPTEKITFVWEPLEEGKVFELDPIEARIMLNREYRRAILGDAPASAADAPLFKMLLFLVVRNEFGRSRSSKKQQERLQLINELLMDVVKSR
ncbi:ATP-binding protein [Phyllobacterium lublinensis]|uniref:ATP-binding protein n=1 Tax=Phyllobacterium lublinensis TaxID=2875708 RepID=UPI001CCDAE67|nr:ATP-binding protein [Phyllobacterium sp. 2063]MBZ9654016.1 ATP-binding protein [Phyllobacterium sp. 2063]